MGYSRERAPIVRSFVPPSIYLNPEKKTRGRLSRYAVVSFSLAAEGERFLKIDRPPELTIFASGNRHPSK